MLQVLIQERREKERKGTRKVNCLEAILPSGSCLLLPDYFLCLFLFLLLHIFTQLIHFLVQFC